MRNADTSNTKQTTNPAAKSGSVAGVESGLGMVESLPRAELQPEQKTHGETFRQECSDTPAGSGGFKFRY
jgi:hypothetical protein